MGCSLNTCYQWRMKRSKITSEVESKAREIFSKFQIHKLIVLDFAFHNNRDEACLKPALRIVHDFNDSLSWSRCIVHWKLNLNVTYKLDLKYINLLLCWSRVVQHFIFFWYHNLWRIYMTHNLFSPINTVYSVFIGLLMGQLRVFIRFHVSLRNLHPRKIHFWPGFRSKPYNGSQQHP